jgi:hypothetical protein
LGESLDSPLDLSSLVTSGRLDGSLDGSETIDPDTLNCREM